MNSIVKKLLPHLISVGVIVALSFAFFSAYTIDGKVLQQSDNQKANAMQAEINKYVQKDGQPVLWTNAVFSGMPTTQIHQEIKGNLTQPVFRALLLGNSVTVPHTNILLAMLSMYILLITLRVDWRLSLIGAMGFGLSSFNMDLIEAGHSTKMVALAFTPMILAGAIRAFRGEYLRGGSLFALALALQLYANHFQMTYYTLMILLVLGIVEIVNTVRTKQWLHFGKAAGTLIVGLALGVLSNLTMLWTTNEYASETIRGKSELSTSERPKEGGLDQKYAFDWSYGVGESLTLIAQNCVGGGASQTHQGTELYDRFRPQIAQSLAKEGVPADRIDAMVDRQISGLFYTGTQPFVGVSIYWGAPILFLFFAGFFLIEDRSKWWLSVAALVMLMIAWGKNFFFAPLMFDIFPYFNKFRAVTQALGLGQLLVVVMGFVTLQRFFDPSVAKATKQRALMFGGGIAALLCLAAMTAGGSGPQDDQMQPEVLSMLRSDRDALARADVFRSLALIAAVFGILWLYINNRLKSIFAVIAIGVLVFGDVWTIAKRILPAGKFETAQEVKKAEAPAPADTKIMADTDPHFRVFDLRNGAFQDAQTSMFHKSIGGYHAAKLMRYQEMIERHFSKFEQNTPVLQWKNMPLIGMLNAKYIILGNEEAAVQQNPFALGNAWFVKDIKLVDNANAEIAEVGNINPRYEAVIQKSYAQTLGNFTPQYDSTARIKLTSYHPNKLEYEYTANGDQLAVFSEVYYPMEKGWNLTIDGQPATFVKANYILRAAKVPGGTHKITMEFAPKSYFTGEKVSMAASAVLLLLFAGFLIWRLRKGEVEDPNNLPDDEPTTPSVVQQTPPKPKKK